MEGYILLKDSRGLSKSALKKLISAVPYSEKYILRGELVTIKQSSSSESKQYYPLHRDPNVYVDCVAEDVAPLNHQEFLLMEGIEKPADRMEVFNKEKLEWGITLKQGSQVYVIFNNTQYARAVVHCKGLIGSVSGIQFGVEILEASYRTGKYGTTDGTFRGHRYFKCQDNCGLFVSLAQLSKEPFHPSVTSGSTRETPTSYAAAAGSDGRGETGPPADNTRFKSSAKESCVDPRVPLHPAPSEFHIGQRVKFYNRKSGEPGQGVICWIGRKTLRGQQLECNVVGIKTDQSVFKSDFECIQGMDQLAPSVPRGHLLFFPEYFVDDASGKKHSPQTSETVEEMKEDKALMKQQEKIMAEAEKAKKASDREHQDFELERMKASKAKEDIRRMEEADKNKRGQDFRQGSFDEVGDQARRQHQNGQQHHIYDDPKDLHSDSQGCKSYAENHKLLHQASYGNTGPNNQYFQDPSPSQSPSCQRHSDGVGHNHADPTSRTIPPQQSSKYAADPQSNAMPHAQQVNTAHAIGHDNPRQDEIGRGIDMMTPGLDLLAETGGGGGLYNHNLEVGSLVQIQSNDSNNPLRYGTIKWIGNMESVRGTIAGIELDEEMDGCTDGTFEPTSKKFFNCPERKGIYYPLESLKPDERYATEIAVDGNPLRDVVEEVEQNVFNFIVDQYIGDEKGIQGDQNSCYLDATVFGLFALSIDFDNMFLQGSQDPNNTISQILWKNIVNPLRMHGVVKFESVMKLRKELESLGRMKGITKDEKDPEEFLNMMFKHTLHTEPFISIRRPFGVEQEYFVQLFFEMDESMSVPTISDLLKRMFHEQQISFTEVPSKLLIQVPRFGKKFKTFQKIIPSEVLNVADVVDLEIPYICHICGEKALKLCGDCMSDFQSRDPVVHFCEDCCKKVHQHRNRKDHRHGWCEEMDNLQQVSNLELLSVICIETSHYVCFTRHDNRWIFFDSMANRVYDKYNIPKVNECTADLNEWVYPKEGDINRLLTTPPRELPELVRRFTQDIYMCVYVQPDLGMY